MLQELEYALDTGRLRKCVEEFAHLSRGDVTGEQFFRKFISSLVPSIRARGMAMWFPAAQDFQCAGATGLELTDYDTDPRQQAAINSAIRQTADNRQPLIVGPGDAGGAQKGGPLLNFKPFPFLYVPVISGQGTSEITLLAVMQIWLPTGFDPRQYSDVISFMQSMAAEAAVFLRAKRIETMAAGNARLQKMIHFVCELSGQYDMKRLGTVLVNWARDITGCDRCAFFAADSAGRLSPVAVSNVEVVNPKSALVRLQMKLAQESIDSMKPTLFQKNASMTVMQGDISDYFVLSHATEALAIPLLQGDDQKLGALLVESHKDHTLDKETQSIAITVASRASKAVSAARDIGRLPMLKAMSKLAAARQKLTTSRPKALLFKYGIPLLLLVAAAGFPMRLMVRSDCMLVPKVRGVAVAEVGGRLKQVFVHEGEIVTAGQPIAKVDDEDLQQNLRLTQEEQQRYQIEANRAEAAGDQAARQIALVEVTRSGRQVDLLKREIDRTWIKCPIKGVILTKDIDTFTGTVIPPGARFCDIGDFQKWQLVNKIPESEVGLLENKLRHGPLPMQFVLNSAPGRQIPATIPNEQSISAVSTAIPGANVFLVRADIDESQLPPTLKSGYNGRSKIPLDRRPALYLATRRFINYLRVRWFF